MNRINSKQIDGLKYCCAVETSVAIPNSRREWSKINIWEKECGFELRCFESINSMQSCKYTNVQTRTRKLKTNRERFIFFIARNIIHHLYLFSIRCIQNRGESFNSKLLQYIIYLISTFGYVASANTNFSLYFGINGFETLWTMLFEQNKLHLLWWCVVESWER